MTDAPAPVPVPSARERFLEAVLASATDVAVIATDRDGVVVEWNQGAEHIFGWPASETLGGRVDRIFTPEDLGNDVPADEMRRARAAGRADEERWHLRRDGTRFWGVGELMPLRDAHGHAGFVRMLRDRTPQRERRSRQRADAEFLRSVLASSGDCVNVLDLDGNLLFMSEGGKRVMEVSDFGLVEGRAWPSFWQGERQADALAAMAAARAGGTGRFRGAGDTMAGNPRYWDVRVTPIFGTDGRPDKLLSVSRDITANHAAEAALREAQSLNTAILNSSRDCIVVLDLAGDALFISPGGVAAMEVDDVDALLGRSWLGVWEGADQDAARAAMEAARAGGSGRFQGFCPTRKGVPKWWDVVISPLPGADGLPERLVSSGRDITARRRAEAALEAMNATLEQRVEDRTRALAAAEARQRALFDTTRQLISVIDLDGILLDANRAALAAAGASLADIVGLPFREAPWFAATPGMQEMVDGALAEARAGRSIRSEVAFTMPGGETRIYDFGITPVRDESGRVVELVPEGTDVTDQRRIEEQLRQSQKMEAVGQLTGGLAHDFNNLLTGITGSLELLTVRLRQGRVGDVERYVAAAQGAARRAAALTHRLLAFSRRQTLDPKPAAINRLVGEMEELIRRTAGPAITVEVVGAAGLWTTLVDPNQLENALLNLCINARDAMPDGGHLTVETANRRLDERAAGERDLPAGQYVSLCVSDNGSGMTPEVVRLAFDPFFTTKPLGMGTGLGLSMVYGFARQSGGQARIYSEVGEGTMVCLYLPRHLGAADQAAPSDAAVPLRTGHDGKTVLVVDDEPTVRMLVVEVLEELGCTAIEAEDGAVGLRVLQSDVRLDLLITDVGLPGGMNGRQVADAGRAVRPDLRVLFITGYAENAAIGNGYLDPGMHVLTKPFAMETLSARIAALVTAD